MFISSPSDVETALQILATGGLVALPTETVYGLGADASNPKALAKLYQVKGRPSSHPVIVHIGTVAELETWARVVPKAAYQLAEAFWPGPLTLILPKAAHVLNAVTGGQDTVGLRMPNHPITLELLQKFKNGIAAPSANRFGQLSPTRAEHVQAALGHDVDCILDGGPCSVGVESTIVDLTTDGEPRILRAGMITRQQIFDVLGLPLTTIKADPPAIRVPGALISHYAPQTPLYLVNPIELAALSSQNDIAVMTFQLPGPQVSGQWIQMPLDPKDYAARLYETLHALDQQKLKAIYIEAVPEAEPWAAIHDRLMRASTPLGEMR